jgi:hypothetical protein
MASMGTPLVLDVHGRALDVLDNHIDDNDLSAGVISCGRLDRSFNLDVGCVAVDLPVVRLWPVGDYIVVQFNSLPHLV